MKQTRKLTLSKETLRALGDGELQKANGGAPPKTHEFICWTESNCQSLVQCRPVTYAGQVVDCT